MNLSLYGTCGKWLMVDCGVTFGDESTPGVDVIMPDISFIAERKDDLVGLVITHGHEDHIGAIQHLWPQLKCPIYATPFTAEMIRQKLAFANLQGRVKIIEMPKGGSFEIGPFKGEMIPVTHSIPESHMLGLRMPSGNVLHTGDWKFDPEPLVGEPTDDARLKAFGNDGVMALIGDSTNAMVPGRSGSEADARKGLEATFAGMKNRIVVTCFASNVARVHSVMEAARKQGRSVTLAGRSMWRNAEIAEACGYLPEFGEILSENEAMMAPRDQIVIICTGCQGEPRAALSRMAVADHPEIELERGDTVIFASRDIPGNEKAISRLQNRLIANGINVLTADKAPVHVSGHPAQAELAQLLQWIRPNLLLPVHGETRHQQEHARIGKECQVPHTLIPADGQIIRLGPGVHEIVTEVQHGRIGLDGKVLRPLVNEVSKDRVKMSYNGAAVITVVLDPRGIAAQAPMVTLMGLDEANGNHGPLDAELADVAEDALEAMPKPSRFDDAAVKHAVGQAVRRFLQDTRGKKPLTEVHIVRLAG